MERTTAQQIADKWDVATSPELAESAAIDLDQNWESGTTTYFFGDGSSLVWAGGSITAAMG